MTLEIKRIYAVVVLGVALALMSHGAILWMTLEKMQKDMASLIDQVDELHLEVNESKSLNETMHWSISEPTYCSGLRKDIVELKEIITKHSKTLQHLLIQLDEQGYIIKVG